MQHLITTLQEGNYSCVIENKEIRTYTKPGVADLYRLVKEDKEFLRGASIADKIIGKAAAGLLILGGVKKVYAGIITLPAIHLLEKAGIEISFGEIVPRILNRAGNGSCPLDIFCSEEELPEKIVERIETFINRKN